MKHPLKKCPRCQKLLSVKEGQVLCCCPFCGETFAVQVDIGKVADMMKSSADSKPAGNPDSHGDYLKTALAACEKYADEIPKGQFFDGGDTNEQR